MTTASHIQTLLSRLHGVRQHGDRWEARCPAHDDQHASLSVSIGDDGRVLLHDHAGCTVETVVSAIGLTIKDLFPSENGRNHGNGKLGQIVATYDYRDEQGKLLSQVVRFQPKDFRPRRSDGSGGWLWNLKGVRRVLYRLPELLAADPSAWVFVVEGEKMLTDWHL